MTLNVIELNKKCLYLVVFSLVLTPSLDLIPGLPAIRLEELFIFSWILLYVGFQNGSLRIVLSPPALILIAYIILLPVSIMNGLSHGYEASFADLIQFIKLFKYLSCFYLSAVVFSSFDHYDSSRFIKKIYLLLFLLSILTFLQYFNVLGLNAFLVPLIADEKYYYLITGLGSQRPIGMIGNPNALGFMFVFMIIFCICASKNSSKLGLFLPPWLILAVGIIAMLLTLSRTALAALLVSILAIFSWRFLLSLTKKRIGVGFLKGGVIFSLLAFFVLNSDFFHQEVLWRFSRGIDLATDTSFNARIRNWVEAYNIFIDVPIVGAGPLTMQKFEHAVDNEYLFLARSYGIVGVALIVFFYGYFLLNQLRSSYFEGSLALVIAALVMMFPAPVLDNLVLFPMLVILLMYFDKCGSWNKLGNCSKN